MNALFFEYFTSFMLPPAKSTLAAHIDILFNFIHFVGFLLLVGISLVICYFIFKYRFREGKVSAIPRPSSTVEFIWSVIPLVLVIIVFMWGFRGFTQQRLIPSNAYEIHVSAKKWIWTFTYDNGVVIPQELHVPVGRPIKLIMVSDDVIHSFFVPDYRVKQDVIPGRYTTAWFEAKEVGESVVFCTEYCGTSHANMLAKVVVHEEEDFWKWLEESAIPDESIPPEERGATYFTQFACSTCHVVDDSPAGIGPSLYNLFGKNEIMEDGTSITVDENYLRKSITEPGIQIVQGYQAVMPSYAKTLNEQQIQDIILYIKTLK